MSDIELRRTALHDVHTTLGASITEFAGWDMPLRYGSELAEHHAVRQHAGIFDLGHMGQIEVLGPRAGRALDRALLGGISAIAVGRARYSMMLDKRGGIIDDLIVYRLEAERFLVVANAVNAGTVEDELMSRCSSAGASIDRSADTRIVAREDHALIAVQGPKSRAILETCGATGLDELRYYAIAATTVGGVACEVARTGYTGEDGFELFVPNRDAVAVWQAVTIAGERVEAVPAGLACRDTLRLEAGMPLYGHELTRRVNPYEAGLGRIVRLEDRFVGSNAIKHMAGSPPSKQLVGLTAEGRRAPRQGTTLR
ncbi:MAG: glycine cleavage system aminomethyltransferase GcvT, partial [Nitriliruptoraceae bacterium]